MSTDPALPFKTVSYNSSDQRPESDAPSSNDEWHEAAKAALKANQRLAELARSRSTGLTPLISRITGKLTELLGDRSQIADLTKNGGSAVVTKPTARVEAQLLGEIGFLKTPARGPSFIELEEILLRCNSLPTWLLDFRDQIELVNGDLAAGRDFVDEDGRAHRLTNLSDPEQLATLMHLLESVSVGRVKAQRCINLGRRCG